MKKETSNTIINPMTTKETSDIVNLSVKSTLKFKEYDMPIKNCYQTGRKYICKNNGTISIFTEQIYQPDECPNYALEKVLSRDKEDVYIIIIDKNRPFTQEEKAQVNKILNEL